MVKVKLNCNGFKMILILCFCFILVIFANINNGLGVTEGDVERVNKAKRLEEVREEFSNIFKYTRVLGVRESEIAGLYEVYIFNERGNLPVIIYYYPEKKLLFLGEIWDVVGNSITGQKKEMFYKEFYDNNLDKNGGNGFDIFEL